jgi:hypothetical protein
MLKKISIIVGILVGTLAIGNGVVDLIERLVVIPDKNETMHLALVTQSPIFSETVEIQPDPKLALRMDINVKIYKTGDIIIESGDTIKLLPFDLLSQYGSHSSFMSAMAAELSQRTINGKTYDIIELRFVETRKILPDGNLEQERIYEDGTVETKIIDIRSNKILETKTTTNQLSESEVATIQESRFKKKVYKVVAE